MPLMPMHGPATIRLASDDDLDLVVDLLWDVAAEGRWIGAEVPFDRPDRRRRLAELVADARSVVFVADASAAGGPTVVGEITVSIASYGVADMTMMLAQGWRGQGLGRTLLDAATHWARQAGAHKMWLEVWTHNRAAIALYRRAGFAEEGHKLLHYRRRNGELWDALLMGLQLDPPETLDPA
jgi:RimJ/RimL family protein N-acetyltransferase